MKHFLLLIFLFFNLSITAQYNKKEIKSFNSNVAVAALTEGGSAPKQFELYQNHPNPFNPSTLIKYDLPKETHVLLRVYNLLGQEVATLVNQNQKAGTYQIRFEANDLVNGFYIYRIQTDDFVKVRKMLFLK